MPFNGSVFTLPNGAINAEPGQIVQSAVWDAIHSDLNTGLTEVMSQLVSSISIRNILCDNGDFAVWQRGSGGTAVISVAASTTAYTADRWYITTGANQAYTISNVSPLSSQALSACAIQRTAAQTGTTKITFGYPLTGREVSRLCGSAVDISLLLSAGANFSPANGTVTVAFYVGTGSAAKRGGGFTNETQVATVSVNLISGVTTAVAAVSTINVPANATQGELQITFTPVGSAGVADTLTVGDVQLEGNYSISTWTPTNYDRIPTTLQFLGCKVFFRKTFAYSTAPAQNAGLVGALCALSAAATAVGILWDFDPVEMFATPSVTTYNPLGASANWADITAAASLAVTVGTTSASSSPKTIWIQSASAAAAAHQILIHAIADAGI